MLDLLQNISDDFELSAFLAGSEFTSKIRPIEDLQKRADTLKGYLIDEKKK